MRGRPVSQVEVEQALLEEVEHLEALTNGGPSPKDPDAFLVGYDDRCVEAAEAEVAWKTAQARGLIQQANRRPEGKTRGEPQYLVEARVLATHEDLYRAYKVTGASKDAHKEALTTSRARIDALRTVSANTRTQT